MGITKKEFSKIVERVYSKKNGYELSTCCGCGVTDEGRCKDCKESCDFEYSCSNCGEIVDQVNSENWCSDCAGINDFAEIYG